MIRWSPKKPEDDVYSIDISITGEEPWNRLSWDYQHGQIPVPGLKGMYSECVRGIVEGLKLIGPEGKRGKINPGYFVGPGREREVKDGEWMLGYSIDGLRCGVIEFNDRVLLASYLWMIRNKAYDIVYKLKQLVAKHEEEDQDIFVYDWITNDQRLEPELVSPAALLVEYLTKSEVPTYQ
jgi:hypothetical protein